jgi:uncharacterized membrane protein YfcA
MLAVFAVSLCSTFFGSICGGGSALISAPLFFELGFSVPVALTLIKSNATMWTFAAARNYLKKFPNRPRFLYIGAAAGLPFVLLGTIFARYLPPQDAKQIIGIFLIGASLILIWKIRLSKGIVHLPSASETQTVIRLLPLAAYEGFFGSGANVIASAILMRLRNISIHEALGWYYVMSFAWCLLASIIYLSQVSTSVDILVATLAGAFIGGHLGSSVALRIPSVKMRYLVIIFGILSGLRLVLIT